MEKGKKGSVTERPRAEDTAGKGSSSLARRTRGRGRAEAAFPVAPPKEEFPIGYLDALSEIKNRIQQTRLKTVLAANSSMILLYWDVGRLILQRQEEEGWGAKVIDRLSSDLRDAYPDMTGLSSRNLKYMRAFAAAWPEPEIVQEALAQITWYHKSGSPGEAGRLGRQAVVRASDCRARLVSQHPRPADRKQVARAAGNGRHQLCEVASTR